ncbi:hypothetical protein LguiA_004680 [Lonicera macranthoides]
MAKGFIAKKTRIQEMSNLPSRNLPDLGEEENGLSLTWIGVSCDLNNQTVTAWNLSGMGLAGTFPPVIGNLSFLTSLDINYNNFNSSAPKELSHLHDLQHLLLFNNSFTGTIPASFGNLTKLESLNLRFNQLTGSVPDILRLSNVLECTRGMLRGEKLTKRSVAHWKYPKSMVYTCLEE